MTLRVIEDAELSSFKIVPDALDDYVASGKISAQAAWLYVQLLGFRNRSRGDNYVWPTRQTLATKCGLKKPQGVDRLLKELQDAGLIISERRQDEKGGKVASRHELMLTHDNHVPSEGYPHVPQEGHKPEELQPEELKIFKDGSEALASLDAPDSTSKVSQSEVASTAEVKQEDRELFARVIEDDPLYSDDSWLPAQGSYALDEVYDFLCSRTVKPIRFPGRYAEQISLRGPEAIDAWLASQGLSRYSPSSTPDFSDQALLAPSIAIA